MVKKLFVGSLPYSATTAQVEELFAKAGKVVSCQVITDKYSGQSKGFAFVEMSTDEETEKAIKELNGYSLDGRAIVVNEARPKEDRPSFSNNGGNRGNFQRSGSGSGSGKRW